MKLSTFSIGLGITFICVSAAWAQPQKPDFSNANPSPTAGGSESRQVNQAADKAGYQAAGYTNAGKVGPALVVIPGEIKSNNATFTQKITSNNIADFAELELIKANFKVLERSDLGPVLNEFQLAYNMGDPAEARKLLQKGRLKSTKWVVKFDILKAEPIAKKKSSFSGGAVRNIIGILGGNDKGSQVAQTAVGSVDNAADASAWLIGMRYKIIDASTTEQIASGYNEEKLETGTKSGSVLGASSEAEGGVTLDTLVQRLVQQSVWEIDAKYK
jgi:hypothetical protein